MDKHFIDANTLLADSFKLAKCIYNHPYHPDFIIGIWRGGTPIAIAVQEYLAYQGVNTDHFPIRTRAYNGIDSHVKEVAVDGLAYVVESVRTEHKLLIVDDVFDSGRSVHAVIQALKTQCGNNIPCSIKIACPWYKPLRNVTQLQPDFFIHTTNKWLVFPHELVGLNTEELRHNKGNIIADIL